MTPTSFKETNLVYGAGDNPNTVQLPVAICTAEHTPGMVFILSKWKFTPEEVQYIVENQSMFLSVMGTSLSPIMPIAANPFDPPYGYKPLELE